MKSLIWRKGFNVVCSDALILTVHAGSDLERCLAGDAFPLPLNREDHKHRAHPLWEQLLLTIQIHKIQLKETTWWSSWEKKVEIDTHPIPSDAHVWIIAQSRSTPMKGLPLRPKQNHVRFLFWNSVPAQSGEVQRLNSHSGRFSTEGVFPRKGRFSTFLSMEEDPDDDFGEPGKLQKTSYPSKVKMEKSQLAWTQSYLGPCLNTLSVHKKMNSWANWSI